MLIVGKRKLLRPSIGHYKNQTPPLIDRWIIINRPEFILWTWLCFTQGNSTGHLHLGFVWSNLRWMTHPENSETSRGASGWSSRRNYWVACYPRMDRNKNSWICNSTSGKRSRCIMPTNNSFSDQRRVFDSLVSSVASFASSYECCRSN